MKTLTEFPGMNLKNAVKTKQDLVAGGKTPEELPQAMGEALKIEGDRLSYLLNALELVESNQEDLKRVVVYSLAEGEKAPPSVVQKGDQFYLVEYYPSLVKKAAKFDDEFKGKKRGKRKGRGGKRGDRNRDFQKTAGPGQENRQDNRNAPGEGRSERPRPPRGPRPPAQKRPPLKPVGSATAPKPVEPQAKPAENENPTS